MGRKKRQRKFNGKVFDAVSDGWDTRVHALRSVSQRYQDTHYIRFTIEGDEYVMWSRSKPKGRR